MKTRAASTSVDAYYAMVAGPQLGEQQRKIVAFLAKRCDLDWTRAELADALAMRVASVCGRVNELLERQVVSETGRRACRSTGRSAHALKLVPAQQEMFA